LEWRYTVISTHPNLDHFDAHLSLGPTSNHMSSKKKWNSLWGTTVSISSSYNQPEVAYVWAKSTRWNTLLPHRRKGVVGGRAT
jgi:hypothetical protein